MPTTATKSKSVTDRVNLLSYDLNLPPPSLTPSHPREYKEERLTDFIQAYLSFYDIVCLQEVFSFGTTRRGRLIKAGQTHGLPYYKGSHLPCCLLGIDGGLLIMSRYPIVRSSEHVFTKTFQSDSFLHKGCIYAKINIRDNFHIHVFNTHLQRRYSSDPALEDKAAPIREQQLTEVRAFMDECLISKPYGEPVFLMGNFNINSRMSDHGSEKTSSPEYHAMIQLLSEGTSIQSEKSATPGSYRVIKDLLFDQLRHHPVTFADSSKGRSGELIPREQCLTSLHDLNTMQCLDYIFQVDEFKDKESNQDSLHTEVRSIKVEEIYYENQSVKLPLTQLSDHYGISTQLLLRRS